MTSLAWAVVGVLGAVLMVRASRGAVRHAVRLGVALRLSPYALGLTVIALGTDHNLRFLMQSMPLSLSISYQLYGKVNRTIKTRTHLKAYMITLKLSLQMS